MPTLIGLIIAAAVVVNQMRVTRLPLTDAFFTWEEMLFVFGASMGCGIMRAAFSDTFFMLKGFGKVFYYSSAQPIKLVHEIIELANINRRDGPIAMQNVEIKNAFLKTATDLVVDGTDAAIIDSTLTTEIAVTREREKARVDYFKFMADVAPAMGMVGTMIGLVAMLKTMDDLGSIGDAFAIALLTTMWGAIFAYLIFKPIAEKLDTFSKTDLETNMLVKEGMLLVKANTNPRIISDRLSTRLAPGARAELAEAQEAATA